jgi:hypothetical protein
METWPHFNNIYFCGKWGVDLWTNNLTNKLNVLAVFWEVTLCGQVCGHFRWRSLHLYQTIWRHISEDCALHSHCRSWAISVGVVGHGKLRNRIYSWQEQTMFLFPHNIWSDWWVHPSFCIVNIKDVKVTSHPCLIQRLRIEELHFHSPVHLNVLVLN